MAIAVREVARQVIANLGLDSGFELAAQWVGQRYCELAARAKFRHLRQMGQVYLPAPINSGTVTVNLDNPTVLLDSQALATCLANKFYHWPDGFTGLWFRPQVALTWYRIAEAYVDPTSGIGTLILETPFAQDNGFLFNQSNPPPLVQSGIPFYILPRYVELAPEARQLGVFVCDFMYRALEMVSQDELNRRVAPNRFLVWAYPQFVAELNSNLNLTGAPKQVEIYPWPTQSITMHYTYWATPRILDLSDYLPPTIDPDIVRTGAMIDACNNRAGKAVRMGNLQEAAYYTNLGNQNRTEFERKILRAIKNDMGAEDLAFTLLRNGWKPPLDWDPIKGAYENFLARGI
jgi:hypothetical protein